MTRPRVVLAVSGSLRAASANARLLETAGRLAPPGLRVTVSRAAATLPHFDPDREDPLPPAAAAWRASVGAADALLVSCPEYAGGLPGAFKNAIDWLIGGPELYAKPVAVLHASEHRGLDAHAVLLRVLARAGTRRVETACIFVPAMGRDLSADAMAADPDIGPPVRRAMVALDAALRGLGA